MVGGSTGPIRANSQSSPLTGSAGMTGSLGGGGGRVRSASPARRALAIDMRRIANLLRDPASAGAGEASMNTSICSSPHSAWEPGDRGAAPTSGSSARAASISRMVMQNQFTALAERINMGVTTLQRQCEADRRRIGQLEKKLEAKLEERADKQDGRERWAEIQGSVNGLIEETQSLTRRVEGLDERLWARTSGNELSKQRNRDLEQQVQALEQQSRLAVAAAEETQKRQATKLRRTEHSLEEAIRRLVKVEEECRHRGSAQRDGYLEARVNAMEQSQEGLDAELRTLQANLEDLQQMREEAMVNQQEEVGLDTGDFDEAVRSVEAGLSTMEKKVSGQIEELSSSLASLRVKVDGQLSRVGTLADRIETAHEPAIESLRAEMAQARLQERRDLDNEVHTLKSQLSEAQETNEEMNSELKEVMRQARAEIAALSLRPEVAEDSSWMRSLDERLASHEQELYDLRARLEELPEAGDPAAKTGELDAKLPEDDLEDLRRRLEWIEEQGAVGAASEKSDAGRIAQVQNTVCDLVEQVSRLKQQASSSEASASHSQQQVQHLQSLVERRQNEDSQSFRVTAEVEAKVGAVSSQVADIAARLLEVEGNMDFARENETAALGEVSVLSAISEAGSTAAAARGLPPLPRGAEADRASNSTRGEVPGGLQEKIEAIAEHLEVVDDLADRMGEVERRLAGGSDCPPNVGGASPGPASEVSFGGDGPFKVSNLQAEGFAKELAELQLRCSGADKELKSLHEALSSKFSAAEAKQELQLLSEKLKKLEEKLAEKTKEAQSPIPSETAPSASTAALETELQTVREEFAKKLSALEAQQAAPRDAPGKADTDSLRSSLTEVKDDLEELQSRVESMIEDVGEGLTAAKAAVEAGMAPIKQELKDLRERMPDASVDKQGGSEEALEAVSEVRSELSSLGKELEALKKESHADRIAELKSKFERLEQQQTSKSPRGAAPDAATAGRLDSLEEKLDEVAVLPKKLEEGLSGMADQKKRLEAFDESLEKQDSFSQELQTELQRLRQSLEKDVAEVKELVKTEVSATKSLASEDTKGEELDSMREKHQELDRRLTQLDSSSKGVAEELQAQSRRIDQMDSRSSEASKKLEDELKSQLKALESKVAAPGGSAPAAAATGETGVSSAEDVALRAQVQQQVEELTAQLTRELASMAEHQKDMVETRATVQDLAAKLADKSKVAGGNSGQEEAIASLKKQLESVVDRVAAAESTSSSMKKDVDSLLGPRNKVGISMGGGNESPLAEVRGRLDMLFEQVAELQTKADDAEQSVSRASAGGSKSGSKREPAVPASADASLNFSLTEQTERPGMPGDGSLNFSLTEQTTKDLLLPESGALGRRPAAGLNSSGPADEELEADSDIDEDILSRSASPTAAAKAASKTGSGSDGTKDKKDDDALDSLMGKSDSASSLSGRPRPSPLEEEKAKEAASLAPVAEEASDAGDPSPNSRGSAAGKRSLAKGSRSPAAGSSLESPLGGSGGALEASFASQVSVSCNEVSIGCDYSVELSTELDEKCDFVEAVRPISNTNSRRQASGVAGSTIEEAGEESDEAPLKKAPATAAKPVGGGTGDALDSLVKPKAGGGGDMLDSLLSGAAKAKSPVAAVAAAKSPKAKAKAAATPSPEKDDDDDYGDASFEDNMSVPESIEEESLEGSGSGAWGSGEAV
eukprot:TRINITY_DN26856_c0_g1_i1.p1 TRINITY_DN26856_c0_g1~~TRINITY_DN26856_c0_g1_i1.p1  ORF type:complete len:1680 (+),score=520.77 TRINITY_DN26856_c0_g1_i1:66-5105(+)